MLHINFYATFRSIIGQKTLELDLPDDSPLHVIFEELFSHYPQMRSEIMDDDARVQEYVSVFINGRDIRYLNELDSTLNSQQKLDIFPPVAGG